MGANDTEHIWLRQTVTFTVDGQTRTLEIGVPLPRNATPQDVEALLGVADAGMNALSRRLDAQVADALVGDASTHTPTIGADSIDSERLSGAPAAPISANTPIPAHEAPSTNGHAPRETREPIDTTSVEEPENARPHEATGARQPHTPGRPNPPSEAPTATPRVSAPSATPPPAPERSATPQRPAPVASHSQPPTAPSSGPSHTTTDTGVELTRAQFLAAAAELGLNPRQAMDQLGVRSLEGLNLREALESLRRQLLGATSSAEPEPETVSEPEIVSAASTASSTSHYFEEEDDEDTILYALDEDNDDDEEMTVDELGALGSAKAQSGANEDALDDIDLEDVPDLSPPPASARQRTTSAARKAPSAATEAPETPASSGGQTQAMQLIGKLRAANGGGTASDYQRNAYRNIVENELGKPQATALVRGLWRTTLDRLSAGQLEALIRWGKEEVFAEEAAQVIATLRAEQRRAEQQAETTARDADHPAEPRATSRNRPGAGSQ